MKKINSKVEGLMEIAIKGQTKLFEKTLKKMQKQKKNNVQLNKEELLFVELGRLYLATQEARYGDGSKSLDFIIQNVTKQNIDILKNQFSILKYTCYGYENQDQFRKLIQKLSQFGFNSHDFYKLRIFNDFYIGDYQSLASTLLSLYKQENKDYQQLSSFFVRIFQNQQELHYYSKPSFENIFDLDPSLDSKQLKQNEMNFKLFMSVLKKQENNLTESCQKFKPFIKFQQTVLTKHNIDQELKNLPITSNTLHLIHRILTSNLDFISKTSVEKIYEHFFTQFFEVVSEDEAKEKEPDWENMNLYLKYFLIKDKHKDLKELQASNSPLQKALQLMNKNITHLQKYQINLKNQYLGIFVVFVQKNWIHEKTFQTKLDEYCKIFIQSYYFIKELNDIINDEQVLKEVYKRLYKNEDQNIFQDLNLYILKQYLGKYESQIDIFKMLIKNYVDKFKQDLELAKGQRREEDQWLKEAIKILKNKDLLVELQKINSNINEMSLLNFEEQILNYGRIQSPYNFDIQVELVRANKKLGNFAYNDEIYYKDDLKGNQLETLGHFYFLEKIMLTNKNYDILIDYLKLIQQQNNHLSSNLGQCFKNKNFEFLYELKLYKRMNQNSYFLNVLYLYHYQDLVLKFFTNFDQSLWDNYQYMTQRYIHFDKYNYLNTDTYIDDMCGILSNFLFCKFLYSFYYLVGKLYLFLQRKEKINEKFLEDQIKKSRLILQDAKEDKHYFKNFKIIRRNIEKKKLDQFLEKQNQKIQNFYKGKAGLTVIQIYEKLLSQVEEVVRNQKTNLSIDFLNLEDQTYGNKFEKMLVLYEYQKSLYIQGQIRKLHKQNLDDIKKEQNQVIEILEKDQFEMESLKVNNVSKILLDDNQLEFFTSKDTLVDTNKLYNESRNLFLYNLNNNYKI